MLDFNEIGRVNFAWVERMGWHTKTVMESMALIASEIGEAAAECLNGAPTSSFGEELADIILRVTDLGIENGVDMNAEPAAFSWARTDLEGRCLELLIAYGIWTTSARKGQLGPDFTSGLILLLAMVADIAKCAGVDLAEQVRLKSLKNEQRGSRGRVI